LRALLVEDREDDAVLLVRLLQREGYAVRWKRVDSAEGLREALAEGPWDVVLCDFRMPGFDAAEALRIARQEDPDLPFIVVSGTVGEEVAVDMMRAGANDYVMKDNLTRLPAAVARELREAEQRRARRQAEAQAQLLWQAVEQGASMVLVLDPDRRVTYVNRRWTEATGMPAEEVVGRPVEEIGFLAVLSDDQRSEIRQAVESGSGWRGEMRVWRRDGSQAWVVLTVSALRDEAGRVERFVCVAEDVTALKEAEERERQLRERLERQVERLQALRAIDVAITGSLDLQVTLSVLLDQVTTGLGVDAACVLLRESGTYTLRPAASRGFREPLQERVRFEGAVGEAVLRGEVVQRDLSDPLGDREERLRAEGFRAYCAIPLVAKGEPVGVLEVLSRSALPGDPEWWGFLEAMAGQAAVAVDNARLLEELRRANLNLQLAYDATLEGWSQAVDLRDRETEGHTQRVTEMTVRLARALGVPEADLVHVRRGALLHDVGKLGIPDSILLKPGPLTEEERAVMRKHPEYAYRWLSRIEFLRPALDIPYCHHERWDGSGYPRGLRGEEIPLAARIFAVADVFDALTSDRPYRKAWSREDAVRYIREQAGRQFDPRVVEAFLREVGEA
jgi:PAS domain S-box-containing protein